MAIQYLDEPPADCGRRLLPVTIDKIAKYDPSRPFISVARTTSAADGYYDVSFKAFSTAVNRYAWWLEEQIGRSQQFDPIFYVGPLDIRYLIVLMAAAKTGHIAFFSSHRNSLKAHLTLLEKIKCNVVLVPENAHMILAKILAERPMRRVPVASLDSLLENDYGNFVEEYPFRGTFSEVKDKPLVILHTSGSTGIPKPVFVTHGTFASQDAQQLIPFLGGKPTWVDKMRGARTMIGLPLFHAACLAKMTYSIFAGGTVLLPPAGPLTADVVDSVFTHGDVDGALIAPSLIVDLYKNPAYYSNMIRRIKFLAYVGGTVSKPIGDDISSKIELITMFGSTETLSHPIELPESREDWEYISYSSFLGHKFRQVENNLCELVISRNPDNRLFQGIFSTFPELNEYGTSDLYEAHPTKKGLWRFRMRSDDIICFNNAEKLNPITMEAIITGHPKVLSAVIGGHGRFQACLLLEPKEYPKSLEEKARFIDEVWPTVFEANKDCPAHGRVMKDFIMLTDPARPIPRSGKGTVQRASVPQLYEREFDQIYDQQDKPDFQAPLSPRKKPNFPTPLSPRKIPSYPTPPPLSPMNIPGYPTPLSPRKLPGGVLHSKHHSKSASGVVPADGFASLNGIASTKGNASTDGGASKKNYTSTNGIPSVNGVANGIVNGIGDARSVVSAIGKDLSPPGMTVPEIEGCVERYLQCRLPQLISEHVNQAVGAAMCQMAANLLAQPKPSYPSYTIPQPPQSSHLSYAAGQQPQPHFNASSFSDYSAPLYPPQQQPVNGVANGIPTTNGNAAPATVQIPLREVLNQAIQETTYLSGLTDDANLFECGLDSVQVPVLVKRINATLGGGRSAVTTKSVYANPSVNQLVRLLSEL